MCLRIIRIGVYNLGMNSVPCPALAPAVAQRPALAPVRRLPFAQLSNGAREVLIEHAGQVYRLSLTAQNKLILTK